MQVSGGVGAIIGFAHDWANPENTRRSWDMVARYVVPEINGYLDGLRRSQKFVIENRAIFERAGQAVMSKIMQNEKAAAALSLDRPRTGRDPRRQRARFAEGSRKAQERGVRRQRCSLTNGSRRAALSRLSARRHFIRSASGGFAPGPTKGYLRGTMMPLA